MWSIDAYLYSYHLYPSGFLYVLSFSLFFLLFLSTFPSFCFLLLFLFSLLLPSFPYCSQLPLFILFAMVRFTIFTP